MTEEYVHNEEDVKFLRVILAANDDEFKLWPSKAVEHAKLICKKNWQKIPSLDAAVNELGLELSKRIYAEIKQERIFINALFGYGSSCHYCGSNSIFGGIDFALMRVDNSNRSWGSTIASAALSAITIPLIGGAALSLPRKSFQGDAYRMRVVACKDCMEKNSNIFGLFLPNKERASKHPLWKAMHDAGFTKLLLDREIPYGLKTDSDL
jgi:hypothetical protein